MYCGQVEITEYLSEEKEISIPERRLGTEAETKIFIVFGGKRLFMYRKCNTLCFIGCLIMILVGCNATTVSEENLENSIEIHDIEQEKELNQEMENEIKEQAEGVNEAENNIRMLSFFDEFSGLLPVSVSTKGEYSVDLTMYPQFKDLLEQSQEEYEQELQNQGSNVTGSVSYSTDIQRADTYAYSVLVKSFTGEGAEKSYLEYTCFNYNVQNGELLKLDDVVKDRDMLILALEEQLESI